MFEKVNNGISIGIIAGVCFLIVIMTILLIILFCQVKKQKFFGCNVFIKICQLFLSFLSLILSIMVIAFIVVTIFQDSGCNVLETLLNSSSPSSELAKLNISIDATTKTMIDATLVEGSSGNLSSVIPNVDFKQVNQLLDGLSSFQSFKT